MILTKKEKTIAIIANGIAAYSLYQEQDQLPKNITMFDFILKIMPADLKPELSMELIDGVFEFVSSTHSS